MTVHSAMLKGTLCLVQGKTLVEAQFLIFTFNLLLRKAKLRNVHT